MVLLELRVEGEQVSLTAILLPLVSCSSKLLTMGLLRLSSLIIN